MPARSMPGGSCSAIVCVKRSNRPRPVTSRITGVSGIDPTPPPGSSGRMSCSVSGRATRARAATVCCSNTCRGCNKIPCAFARDTNWIEPMLSPPRAKNDSSTPTRSRPSRSPTIRARTCSVSVDGAR